MGIAMRRETWMKALRRSLPLLVRAIVEDFILVPVHTFNTPFEYHLDDVEMKPLELIVTVYSETERSQQAPVGYTTMTVPYMLPGCHSLRAPLWRPHQTGREFLRSALVGGAPSLLTHPM
ncbi:hypothetical protein TcBrA4_0136610 [Trypanosoma cruzi]|nr:hypothetical protein TcBrA4_0136610 [Trypanosoma cruzi]